MNELAPYPDELAYSVLARVVGRWKYSYNAALLREMFGGPVPAFDHVFSPTVHRLAEVLGYSSARKFSAAHTLLPFYAAYMDKEAHGRLLQALEDPAKAARMRERLTGVLKRYEPPFLRVCVDCLHLDRVRYGEVYWHRAHQLPNVQTCARHRRMLSWTKAPYREQSRLELWSAAHATEQSSAIRRCVHLFGSSLSVKVERDSLIALTSGLSSARGRETSEYRLTLHLRGYSGRFGKIDLQRLNTDFTAFAATHGFAPASLGPDEWWLTMHQGSRRESPLPVHHILFQHFLRGEYDFKPAQKQFPLEEQATE